MLGIKSEKNLQVGTITIGLCILSEIKPHIFGFDLGNLERTHYFESRPISSSHDPKEETKAIKNLIDKGQITCD